MVKNFHEYEYSKEICFELANTLVEIIACHKNHIPTRVEAAFALKSLLAVQRHLGQWNPDIKNLAKS